MESEARQRILDAAATLFAERGYAAVTLRDIATAVRIQHASLYHHVPGGKAALFVEVTERGLIHHRDGLTAAMVDAGPVLRAKLFAAATWFMSHPPLDLVRMTYADMPAVPPADAARISRLALDAVIRPIRHVLAAAQEQGEICTTDIDAVAGGLVGMVESLHAIPAAVLGGEDGGRARRIATAQTLIDIMLRGLSPTAAIPAGMIEAT